MPGRRYLRFPHLRADLVVFVAENDVWAAPAGGGRAYRITADGVPVANPRLSPDATLVAWSSRRDGAWETYVTDLDGGPARRLTWWGDRRARTIGWTPEGEVLVVSSTGEPTRRTWVYRVPVGGGTPVRVACGPASDVALGAAGEVLLCSVDAHDMAWWKRYRGGAMGRLWWNDGQGEYVRRAAGLDGQIDSPMLVGDRIAFLSDHEGWGNLYSLDRDGDDLRRHTDHGSAVGDDDGAPSPFYARHAATDGTRVVYEAAGQLWVLDSLDPTALARRRQIALSGPRIQREPFRLNAATWLNAVAPDRTGRTSIVQVRGTVHRLTHRDGPARSLFAEPGARARLARPLGEGRAVWVDDLAGEDAVCIAPLDEYAADAPQRRRVGAGEIGRVLELAVAPDASAVALAAHDGRLLLLDVATAGLRELARGAAGEMSDLAWSPDSRWIAYCDPVEAGRQRIMLVQLARAGTDDGPEADVFVAVTEPRFLDADPTFTSDGKYLAFLSRRSFDPIYDQHSFDLTFPASWRPFLVPLAARTPSPFGASPDGRPVTVAEEGPGDPPAPEADDPSAPAAAEVAAAVGKAVAATAAAPAEPPPVVVDAEGLAARVVPIPVSEGRYRGMSAGKDCLLWYSLPVSGVLGDGRADTDEKAERPMLVRYDISRRKLDLVVDALSWYAVSGDGTRLVVRDKSALRVLRTDRPLAPVPATETADASADEFEVDTTRLIVTVDPAAEWRQMFAEAGRLMRDHFWVEDMAGVDWAAELDRYRPLVEAVGSKDDLVDVLWELQGELGTSHAYVMGGDPGGDPAGRPGLLGADLEPAADGWRVVRVLPPETSAPAARSPLAGPGVDVRPGDVIVEVAGRRVDPALGPAPLLLGTADTLVELTVRSDPDSGRAEAGEVRRVVVRPLADEGALRYQDWVAGRRAFVADRSAGRLGYLHVPDMMAAGWSQLHRDLGRETARDGLVVDVRGNGGGHTSQLVVEKLARRVIGWDWVRHRQPETYPVDAPRGPVVAITDECAGSDGDIVTAAIKRMGIGPVVGVRTWGGVIGIDSRYGLVDGTRVTQPRYAFWFDDVAWDVENRGVEPDVEVVMTPQDWIEGRDPQLERAVDIAMAALAERPAVRPPDPATRPSRARPSLPPRPSG